MYNYNNLYISYVKFHKTYKYKLKPTKEQEETFESWVNTCRYIYNIALEERITAYKMSGKFISKINQQNQLPELKNYFPFLKDVHSQVLQDPLIRLDKAYKTFFKGGGFPRFAKKKQYNSFTFPSGIKVNQTTIKLPKIGEVKYYNSRPIIGTPKTATIIKEADGWYICITSEYTPAQKLLSINKRLELMLVSSISVLYLTVKLLILLYSLKTP